MKNYNIHNIGIIGHGIVGQAIDLGFKKLGHTTVVHDIKYDTKIEDIKQTEICFICVPTPATRYGSCDISIVENIITQLAKIRYLGHIVIKSTIPPGTTDKFISNNKVQPNDHLVINSKPISFVPEFLRERCAIHDFIEEHNLLAIGSNDPQAVYMIRECHGTYPKETIILSPTEAELLKYYSNIFNAMRIIFANEMYEVAQAVGANYRAVKNAFILKGGVEDKYLDVNDSFRGYGGTCLPKDVKAIRRLVEDKNLDLDMFRMLDEENKKLKTTVMPGMRKQ